MQACCCWKRATHELSWLRAVVMGLLTFPLLKLQPLRGVGGCGACGKGKGRNGGKRGETVFWGNTKPVVVVCGTAGWRKRADRMRSKLD
eukprot:scaffold131179_cov59-Attheya_sp.AAC.1